MVIDVGVGFRTPPPLRSMNSNVKPVFVEVSTTGMGMVLLPVKPRFWAPWSANWTTYVPAVSALGYVYEKMFVPLPVSVAVTLLPAR